MSVAYLDWSLWVERPKYGNDTDLSAEDDDSVYVSAIFHNNWGALNGTDVVCSQCHHEFKLDKVEY